MGISVMIAYASMTLLAIALAMVMKRKIVFIVIAAVFIGIFCNRFVMNSNGGKMPVFIQDATVQAQTDFSNEPRHQAGTKETKYAYLADFITTSKTENIYSPGDISMTLGPVLLALSVLWQIVYTLRYEGLSGFMYNNLPISYPMTAMSLYAAYLGYQHLLLYA